MYANPYLSNQGSQYRRKKNDKLQVMHQTGRIAASSSGGNSECLPCMHWKSCCRLSRCWIFQVHPKKNLAPKNCSEVLQ